MKCPDCDGKGQVLVDEGNCGPPPHWEECERCRGTGRVDEPNDAAGG